jgi:hypothetical protein
MGAGCTAKNSGSDQQAQALCRKNGKRACSPWGVPITPIHGINMANRARFSIAMAIASLPTRQNHANQSRIARVPWQCFIFGYAQKGYTCAPSFA